MPMRKTGKHQRHADQRENRRKVKHAKRKIDVKSNMQNVESLDLHKSTFLH